MPEWKKIPNLFLVGHPRTGTSALHDFLNQHPDIFMSFPKEPVYFASDLQRDSDLFHKRIKYFFFRNEHDYLKLFDKQAGQRVAGESTAVYLYSKSAAGEIHRFNPGSKIIMTFREPVSWLYSFHSKARQILGEDRRELKDALAMENERKHGRYLSPDVMAPSLLFYTEFLRYAEQVQRYLNVFDRRNIKILIYDDFKKDNRGVYKEILKFLDVDPGILPDFKTVNASKSLPIFPVLQRVIHSLFIRKAASTLIHRNIYSKITKIYWDKFFNPDPGVAIDEKFRLRLMVRFKPEVESLSQLLGRDLVKLWGYNNI